MLFIGMDGIGGLAGIGMGKVLLYMGGLGEGGGFVICYGNQRRYTSPTDLGVGVFRLNILLTGRCMWRMSARLKAKMSEKLEQGDSTDCWHNYDKTKHQT